MSILSNISFASVEHVIATAASDIVKAARAVASFLQGAAQYEKPLEALTEALVPGADGVAAVEIERCAFASLAVLVRAVDGVDAAASANGVNITLDAQMIKDVQAITPTIKRQIAAMSTPAAPASTTAIAAPAASMAATS